MSRNQKVPRKCCVTVLSLSIEGAGVCLPNDRLYEDFYFCYLIIAISVVKGIILRHTNVIVSQQMVLAASPLRKVN